MKFIVREAGTFVPNMALAESWGVAGESVVDPTPLETGGGVNQPPACCGRSRSRVSVPRDGHPTDRDVSQLAANEIHDGEAGLERDAEQQDTDGKKPKLVASRG